MEDFALRSRFPLENWDVTLGAAGLLLGCAELVEALPTPWVIDITPIRQRGDELAKNLLSVLQSSEVSKSTNIPYLGIAHGWGGLLFALLRWAKATDAAPDEIVRRQLDRLCSFAQPHGEGVRWPIHNMTRRPLFMEGWCNGTAGHILLLALADQVLEPGAYVELAKQGAQSVWETRTELGTLCCGLGGIGYALLSVYRLTDEEIWLQRARQITHRAAVDASGEEFRESLYKGALGAALLVEDLKQPRLAAMPFFEPTG